MKLLTMTLALTATAGCAGTVMTCPRLETPVLLGPIDQIGGAPQTARAELASDGNLRAEAERSFQITHAAGGTYTRAVITPRFAGSAPIWKAEVHADSDVHVRSARASGFVWDALGMFWMDNEVHLDMTVAKVGAK